MDKARREVARVLAEVIEIQVGLGEERLTALVYSRLTWLIEAEGRAVKQMEKYKGHANTERNYTDAVETRLSLEDTQFAVGEEDFETAASLLWDVADPDNSIRDAREAEEEAIARRAKRRAGRK